jgi:hypothetical protein
MTLWLDIGVIRKILSSEYQAYASRRSRAHHRDAKIFESLDLDPMGHFWMDTGAAVIVSMQEEF